MTGIARTGARRSAGYDLRREMGEWIRDLREAQGLTQADLATALGMGWATAISAVETGRSALPPEHYLNISEILGVNHKEFAKKALRFTSPWLFAMLYDTNPRVNIELYNHRYPGREGAPRRGNEST